MVPNTEKKSDKHALGETFRLAWGLGYRIALPIVVLALGGRFLDKRFGTGFLFLLVGIFLSIIVSSLWLIFAVKRLFIEIQGDEYNIKNAK